MVGPEDLFLAGGIVSGTGGVLDEAASAIVAAIALLALGSIPVSYGVGAAAMTAVSSLCIHALYGSQQQQLSHYLLSGFNAQASRFRRP